MWDEQEFLAQWGRIRSSKPMAFHIRADGVVVACVAQVKSGGYLVKEFSQGSNHWPVVGRVGSSKRCETAEEAITEYMRRLASERREMK